MPNIKYIFPPFLLVLACVILAFFNIQSFKKSFDDAFSLGEFKKNNEKIAVDQNKLAFANINYEKRQINFVGDIMLGRDVERHLNKNGLNYPYLKLRFNNDTAYTVANFESSIPVLHVPAPNNTFRFSVDKIFLPALRMAGFTHLSLANNHSFDFGLPGYNNAVSELWNNDFVPFGHPTILATSSVVVLTIDNTKISLIGVHTLYGNPSKESIEAVLDHAKTVSDIQIVYIHWGEEYSEFRSKSQRELATVLAAAGTDIIIGHHPHVVQGIEKINDTLVFYSLGNFIFDQYFSPSVQNGLMLTLSLGSTPMIQLIPITSQGTRAQPQEMAEKDRVNFLTALAGRSDLALTSSIASGTVPFAFTLATSSEVVIMAE